MNADLAKINRAHLKCTAAWRRIRQCSVGSPSWQKALANLEKCDDEWDALMLSLEAPSHSFNTHAGTGVAPSTANDARHIGEW